MRQPHLLKANDHIQTPSRVIFVDTETTLTHPNPQQIVHQLRLGVAVYIHFNADGDIERTAQLRFTEVNEFWNWLTKINRYETKLIITSHNLDFDFVVLQSFTQLQQRSYQLSYIAIEPRAKMIHFAHDKSKLQFVDNSSLFPGPLAKWGKSLQLPKLDMPQANDNDEIWFTYCERDVLIMVHLWKNWIKTLKTEDLGSMRFTIASQSFNIYRHKFMRYPIFIHNDTAALQLERQSYHGGRVTPFRIGHFRNDQFFKLDINSMYPYVMHKELYPTCLDDHIPNCSINRLAKLLDNHAVIADVLLTTDEDCFPTEHDGRSIFAVGTLRTVLTTPELQYAIQHNMLKQVYETLVYRKRPIFRDFVEYFYAQKLQAEDANDELRRNFMKIILNSLYGKFGQRGRQTRILEIDDAAKPILSQINHEIITRHGHMLTFQDIAIVTENTDESYNSFPAIAAHVTAYARMYLYHLIQRAGRNNVFYCDTDSLIVNRDGYERLSDMIDPRKIGYLKVEGIAQELAILAPKDYRFGEETKRKGIPKNAPQVADNSFQVTYWPTFKTHLKEHREANYMNKIVTKTLKYAVNYGLLQEDGSILPFRLNQS